MRALGWDLLIRNLNFSRRKNFVEHMPLKEFFALAKIWRNFAGISLLTAVRRPERKRAVRRPERKREPARRGRSEQSERRS